MSYGPHAIPKLRKIDFIQTNSDVCDTNLTFENANTKEEDSANASPGSAPGCLYMLEAPIRDNYTIASR